jgi:hypothetical protein
MSKKKPTFGVLPVVNMPSASRSYEKETIWKGYQA